MNASETAAALLVALHLPPDRLFALYGRLADLGRVAWAVLTLKRSTPMNILELVPLAIEAGQDALALTHAVQDHSKEETVAAVEQSLPLLAKISGQPLEALQEFLTPEAVGAAYDLVDTGLKIGALVEDVLKKRAAAAA